MSQSDSTDLSPLEMAVASIARIFGQDVLVRPIPEAELKLIHLTQDQILFEQGDPGDSMYILTQGRLGVRLQKADGSPLDWAITRTLGRGYYLLTSTE
jgi:hypothetical protein